VGGEGHPLGNEYEAVRTSCADSWGGMVKFRVGNKSCGTLSVK
jgi:hypothetical protein